VPQVGRYLYCFAGLLGGGNEAKKKKKKKKKKISLFLFFLFVSKLQSKVPVTKAQWDNRYALIGVYDPSTAAYEFEPLEPSKLSGTVREKKKKKKKKTLS
jgi:hypothetical protein